MIDRDFPDPGILALEGRYYAYATNGSGANVQVARSRDLIVWEPLADALPVLPAWAVGGLTWAPAVISSGAGYRLYFTARSRRSGRQCIGVAVAAQPEGPFHALDAPLIVQDQEGGAIDPFPFVDEDGRSYIVWKNDGNALGLDTWIQIQATTPDGLRREGAPARLIRGDLPWEGNLVEAPTLFRRGREYHLLYSANRYRGPDYAIGWAVSENLLGPYRKAAEPLARTGDAGAQVLGPGGQDLVVKDGRSWLVYHSWDRAFSRRRMHVDELIWQAGRPAVRVSAGEAMQAP